MTGTPSVMFATRPTPPVVTDPEYQAWSRRGTLNYDGGYIEATYGDLIQTWSLGETDACAGVQRAVVRTSTTRTNTIGGAATPVAGANYVYTAYPKRNSSLAAGGDLFTVHTDIGSYTARVGGDIQTLIAYVCNNTNQLYAPISIQSSSGAWYGPFSPSDT
tara:strand:+ start:467 stop:949 length:483 start_codon:yes stop_codon:yes gene_type:complete